MMDYKFQYSAAISLKWIKDNMMGLIFPDITKWEIVSRRILKAL